MTVGAVAWKETREQLLRGGRPLASTIVQAAVTLFVAGLVPFGFHGAAALGKGAGLAIAAGTGFSLIGFVALMTPLGVVIDTLAGERERHTLETLLATPVSDSAILVGKVAPIGLIVVGNAVWYGLVSCVSLGILYGAAGLGVGVALLLLGPLLGLLTSSFSTGLGLFLSQRAPTIKQGQQWLGLCMMPFFLLLWLIGPTLTFLGRGQDPGRTALLVTLGTVAGAVLFLGVNVLFWVLSFARFRRDRLLLR